MKIVEGMLVRSDFYEGIGIVVRIVQPKRKSWRTWSARPVAADVLWPHLTSTARHWLDDLEIVVP